MITRSRILTCIHRLNQKKAALANFWLYVVLAMFALLTAFYATRVYLVWALTSESLRFIDAIIAEENSDGDYSFPAAEVIPQIVICLIVRIITHFMKLSQLTTSRSLSLGIVSLFGGCMLYMDGRDYFG